VKLPWLFALALVAAPAQDKTYDLKLDWKPMTGYTSELTDTGSSKMVIKMTGLPDALVQGGETSFAAVETVISAAADGGSVRSWKFSTATDTKDGQKVVLGFQGKTVIVKHVKGQPREFSFEGGGAIGPDDLAALKKAFNGGDPKPGDPTGAEIFAPKSPVKVGESWSPDVKAMVSTMDAEMANGIDFTKSTATLTLTSVETRAGAVYGKIDGVIQLVMGQMGPMKLDTPLTMKMTLHLDACIDGKQPDGVMGMAMEMKGLTSAAGPAGKIDLDLDMSMTGQKTVKTVKTVK
jgi:hypothetical protein